MRKSNLTIHFLLPCIALAATLAGCSRSVSPQGITASLDNLATLRQGTSKRISSFDRTGGNRDTINIGKDQTKDLAVIQGAGVIRHIWFTVLSGDPMVMRDLTLRMYWDGAQDPCVESPLGDFFGVGHGAVSSYSCAVLNMSASEFHGPKAGINCYFPMPFSNCARITLSSEGKGGGILYYQIDYDVLPSIPEDMGRFHAWWNRNTTPSSSTLNAAPALPDGKRDKHNLTDKHNYLIADIEGRGHYVGCNLSIESRGFGWWGEGDDMFMVDGLKWPPDLHGTGSEDYFGHAWGMQKENAFPFNGVSYHKEFNRPYGVGDKITSYRYHIADPVVFQKSLRVTIEHGGAYHPNDRADDMTSVAYWYQTHPHKTLPPFPPVEERQPLADPK